MSTWRTIACLALAAASAACGTLADGDYQRPPIATIRGVLNLPAEAPPASGGSVRVLLVWQEAAWTPDPGDVWWQANPLSSGLSPALVSSAPSCARPANACDWTGIQACTVRYGRADLVATVPNPGPGGSVEFEAPIFSLPPPEARHTLGSRGGARLAIGYLLFEVEGAGGAGTVLASSAFNGPTLEPFTDASGETTYFTSPYHASYYLTWLEGGSPPQGCGAACDGDPAAPRPSTNPGLVERLPAGFRLVVKLEREDSAGRLAPVALSHLSLEARVALTGNAQGQGGAWCDAIEVSQQWGTLSPLGSWERCTSGLGTFGCTKSPARPNPSNPCQVALTRFEAGANCPAQAPSCGPAGAFVTDTVTPAETAAAFRQLPSGNVLAVGAAPGPGLEAVSRGASLYETGHFQGALPDWWPLESLTFARGRATVTSLPASGEVLVTGGAGDDDGSRTAERFDPATGRWIRTSAMVTPRSGHTATLLPTGEVLVLGGRSSAAPQGAWGGELYDPVQGTWLPFDPGLEGPLAGHSAIPLEDDLGTVLVTGPEGGPEAFLCLRSGCAATGSMGVGHPGGTFTRLPSGLVLALGGSAAPTSAEQYDPLTRAWSPLPPMLPGRTGHAALLLPSGEVLVAGGQASAGGPVLDTADRYHPDGERWTATGTLRRARSGLALLGSADGGVLVLGGHNQTGDPLPVERYCPGPAPAGDSPIAAGRATGP